MKSPLKRTHRFFWIGIALTIVFLVPLLPLYADDPTVSAYETPFLASVVYFNGTDDSTANLFLNYYPATRRNVTATPGSVLNSNSLSIPALGSRSLTIQNLYQKSNTYQGGGIVNTTQPIHSVLVFNPQYTPDVANQMISSGFTGNGATTVYVPTVSKSYYGMNSIIAAQNVSTSPINVTLDIYNNNGTAVVSNYQITGIRQGSSAYFDIAQIYSGGDFSGSARLTSTGAMHVTVAELSDEDGYAAMFEGGSASNYFYFPSMPCNSYNATGYVAVRNTTSTSTQLTLTYRNPAGTPVPVPTWSPTPIVLGGNKKISFSACDSTSSGFAGTMVLGSSTSPVVAVAKVKEEAEFQSAYTGITQSGCQLIFPFVRWAHNDNWGQGAFHNRTHIAIQNVGSFTVPIEVYYLDKDGAVASVHSFAGVEENQKINSEPSTGYPALSEFGYYSGYVYGGSVVIQAPSGSELVAMARVTKKTGATST